MTANDSYNKKLQTLRKYSKIVKFSKVNSLSIAKKLKEICDKENISYNNDTIKNLARWSSGDMRSALMDLQMVTLGKNSIDDADLAILGFRERGSNIFNILPSLFRSKNINASRKVMMECDKDSDEIFWWVESNIPKQFKDPESISNAYDLLSKADIFRSLVMKQQNWRFKAYMSDLIAGISHSGEAVHGFIPVQPPDRFIMLGRTKGSRMESKELFERIGNYSHTSTKVVKNSYMPYLKLMMKREYDKGITLTEEDLKILSTN